MGESIWSSEIRRRNVAALHSDAASPRENYHGRNYGVDQRPSMKAILVDSKEVLFLADKAFQQFRRNGGSRTSTLPDFFIGAQATEMDLPLLTRDTGRYLPYFSTLRLITP